MSAKQKKTATFEECFHALEQEANALKNEDLTLEQSYDSYKAGMEHYNTCRKLLDELKQKIEVYDQRLDELKEVE